jgi:hypothetical protein
VSFPSITQINGALLHRVGSSPEYLAALGPSGTGRSWRPPVMILPAHATGLTRSAQKPARTRCPVSEQSPQVIPGPRLNHLVGAAGRKMRAYAGKTGFHDDERPQTVWFCWARGGIHWPTSVVEPLSRQASAGARLFSTCPSLPPETIYPLPGDCYQGMSRPNQDITGTAVEYDTDQVSCPRWFPAFLLGMGALCAAACQLIG